MIDMHKVKADVDEVISSSLSIDFLFKKSVLAIAIASFVGQILAFKFLNKANHFNLADIREIQAFSCRIVAAVHGFFCFLFAGLYLKGYITLRSWYKLLAFSVGYFLFDLSRYLYLERVGFNSNILESLIHHVLLLFVIVFYVEKYPKLSAVGFLSELTNTFLHGAWFLYKSNLTHLWSFKILSLATVLAFAFFRVYNFTKIWINLYQTRVCFFELACWSSFVLMNYYWFILILGVFINYVL